MATVTRAHLREALYWEAGLSRDESARLVDSVLETISDRLSAGEAVKLSSFGSFTVRGKAERIGRNPKTREEWPVSARRVVVFWPSHKLRDRVNGGRPGGGPDTARR